MNAFTEHRSASDIYYRRYGNNHAGSALILCHGLASNSSRWHELASRIELPAGWCLLCPDLRGHGRSQWRGRLTSTRWMNDLVEIIESEQLKTSVVGGHCMGANLAIRFGLNHPEHCNGLMLIEPMLPQARLGKMRIKTVLRWLLPWIGLSALAINMLGIHRREMPILDLSELDRETRRAMAEEGNEKAMTTRYASPLPDLQYISTTAYMQSLTETLKRVPPLDAITQPALCLISSGGMFGDPDLTEKALRTIPHAEVHRLQARHWIPTEQPEALKKLSEAWLLTRFG
jgi:pimeloyl-ACP methyl ester carboxylesterase